MLYTWTVTFNCSQLPHPRAGHILAPGDPYYTWPPYPSCTSVPGARGVEAQGEHGPRGARQGAEGAIPVWGCWQRGAGTGRVGGRGQGWGVGAGLGWGPSGSKSGPILSALLGSAVLEPDLENRRGVRDCALHSQSTASPPSPKPAAFPVSPVCCYTRFQLLHPRASFILLFCCSTQFSPACLTPELAAFHPPPAVLCVALSQWLHPGTGYISALSLQCYTQPCFSPPQSWLHLPFLVLYSQASPCPHVLLYIVTLSQSPAAPLQNKLHLTLPICYPQGWLHSSCL